MCLGDLFGGDARDIVAVHEEWHQVALRLDPNTVTPGSGRPIVARRHRGMFDTETPAPMRCRVVSNPHRVLRDGDLLDPVGRHRRTLEDPVRDGRHPLRRDPAGPDRRSRGASPHGPVPRGERTPGVHRGRGRSHRRPWAPGPGSHRRDDGSRRAGRHPLPGRAPAGHPAGTGGHADIGPLHPDRRRADGPADATAGPPQAVRPVLAVDRLDDAGTHLECRRLVEPRTGRRQPVPAPLGLRRQRAARGEVGGRRLHDVVQRLVRRPDAVGRVRLPGRRRQRRVRPRAAALDDDHARRRPSRRSAHSRRAMRSWSRALPAPTST